MYCYRPIDKVPAIKNISVKYVVAMITLAAEVLLPL